MPDRGGERQGAGRGIGCRGRWQYRVGGGVASFDCNGEGFPDMLLAGGENKAKFYLNQSKRGGALKFAAEQSGLELDSVTGLQVLKLFRRIVNAQGVTIIIATHDPTINEIAHFTYPITTGKL